MAELSFTDLQTLAQSKSTSISLYMPAEKAGAETRKNPLRFKNLLSEAEDKLTERSVELEAALKSARAYIERHDFWQHQDSGLAFFINRDGVKYYRLPYSFDKRVEIGNRFYLKSLLPLVTNNNEFYLLALSQNEVKFFLGSRYGLNQIELPQDVPPSLAEALKYDDPEKQTQYHSGDAGGSPIYHGQGVGTTDNKDEIKRYFQQIDSSLTSALNESSTPLILAGVEFLLPISIYHEVNSYNNLLEAGITGNPENVATQDLHQQAWAIIEPRFASEKQAAIAEYHNQSSAGLSSSRLEEIIAGAANGQIETLFVTADAQVYGQFDRQANKVQILDEAAANSMDLIDFAATQTYLQKGEVYTVDATEMPEGNAIAAILRFPLFAEPTAASA
ncbi:MAG: hypothetical protein AAFQ23_02015 [Cyanobacteria bacterium J06623_1]